MKTLLRFLAKSIPALIAIFVLAVAVWVSMRLLDTPVKPPRERAQPTVPVVGIADLTPADHPISVDAYGTVVASRELIVRPEVRGRIVELHPNLQAGGLIEEGEMLVRIDPAEFKIAVARAQAALGEVEVEWKIEQGRQAVALREWELLKGQGAEPGDDNALALRKPQLQKIEAMRAKAQADFDDAKLALDRAVITAPFDAVVIQESVEVGQVVDTNTQIGKLVGTKQFWIEAMTPVSRVPLIRLPGEQSKQGASVEIRLDTGGAPVVRAGQVLRQLPDLDTEGRMARILIVVDDPLNLEATAELQPLPIGAYVRLHIDAGELKNVIAIPQTALRENDRVWIRDAEGILRIRDAKVEWRRESDLLISGAFADDDRIITTHLSGVIPGIPVRARSEDDPPAAVVRSEEVKPKKGKDGDT